MIFHLEKIKIMKIKSFVFLFLLSIGLVVFSQDIPKKPVPPRLVNDLGSLLTAQEKEKLEEKLVNFSKQTTTQIVIVTVQSLDGYDKADFAYQIGETWKVGQKGFDNGVVILVKNKTADSKGETFIAIGYGLESVIPDATAKRIVEHEMIPAFKVNQFYTGLDNATSTLMSLSLGEFSAKEYEEKTSEGGSIFSMIFMLVIFAVIFSRIFGGTRNVRRNSIGRGIPFWIALSMLGSSSRGGGSFGNFSSGSGGFGGFGGGSFGGGGAGGSW